MLRTTPQIFSAVFEFKKFKKIRTIKVSYIGISDSVIAAIFYTTASGLMDGFRDPLKSAIDDTCIHFAKVKSVEIDSDNLEKVIMGEVAQNEINKFKDGEKFIEGEKLAIQFAIFGDFFIENEGEILETAKEIMSYFKDSFMTYLLKNPSTSALTLSKIQEIIFKTFTSDHIQIFEELNRVNDYIKKTIESATDKIQGEALKNNELLVERFERLEQQNSELKSSLDSITDIDLKVLTSRISKIPEDKRFRFGIVDIFGIPTSYIKNDFKAFLENCIKPIINAKVNLDETFITGVIKKASLEISGMGHLLYVSPFTRQAAMPYLFDKIHGRFYSHNTPKPLGEKYFKTKASDETIIFEIKKRLFLIAEKVLKNDFSDFKNPPHLFGQKKKIAIYIHKDFSKIDEIENLFEKEITSLKEILSPVITKYIEMVESPTTVVVKDTNIFETDGLLELMLRTAKAVDDKADS